MSDGIYIAMNGAAARAAQLEAVADNLANAQTPGFKSTRPAFEAFLPPSGAPDQAFAAVVAGGTDVREGARVPTGNALDVAVVGEAFLAVQTTEGPAFTRDGRIAVGALGHLEIGGREVLGESGEPIVVPPGARVVIDPDRTVRADGIEVDRLAAFALTGPLERVGPSLYRPQATAPLRAPDAQVAPGHVEGSNASVLEATVALVSVQRHYESSLQAVQTYRRLDERANEIGRVR